MNSTHPNPRVGCVIALGGKVVGRGWHEAAGQRHAEIAALEDAGDRACGATAYVTLEPCSYHGRTAPCSQALVAAGIERVVSATQDPNPEVSGKGNSQLEEAGIKTESGLMESEARVLNAGFFKRMLDNRPWVRIKLAQSLDGRTALKNGSSKWISGAESRRDVQEWRARSSAIVTGIGTLLADNPSLNVRAGEARRQPMRVIVDGYWRTPANARVLSLPGQVLVAGRRDIEIPTPLADSGAELLALPGSAGQVDLDALVAELANREINEVQVEAGATLCGALIEARLVDEILVYLAPVLLGGGARGAFGFGPLESMREKVGLKWIESVWIGRDLRLRLEPEYGSDT
jgi:diaminohydroxyphosphoribosylaminopyrimidine deaminase/5-amino-6-(5-phosphoribosylamino)uracil reductase